MRLGTTAVSKLMLGNSSVQRVMMGTQEVWSAMDPDAADYIARIVSAGSSMSAGNQAAVDTFVRGLKADGIWTAIKAACIMCASDTLTGALVPLVGPAPTNFGFVAGDYSRTNGIARTGGKWLRPNRMSTDDPANNHHLACYISAWAASGASVIVGTSPAGATRFRYDGAGVVAFASRSNFVGNKAMSSGFLGLARYDPAFFQSLRGPDAVATINEASYSTTGEQIGVGSTGQGQFPFNATYAFYSIGLSLDLALLRARIATLMASLS